MKKLKLDTGLLMIFELAGVKVSVAKIDCEGSSTKYF
jgi:hypothetical protein